MKQLNNKTTGEIITYSKSKETGIFYTIWENSFYRDLSQHGLNDRIDYFDEKIEIEKTIFEGNFISTELVRDYQTLLQLQSNFKDFDISTDLRNWHIESGSTGKETLYRVFITNKAYDNALKTKNDPTGQFYPLWMVISFGTETIDAKYSQITDNSIVLYLVELLPEHRQILEMYVNDGVIIENKYEK
jgi:hypothetical protein